MNTYILADFAFSAGTLIAFTLAGFGLSAFVVWIAERVGWIDTK